MARPAREKSPIEPSRGPVGDGAPAVAAPAPVSADAPQPPQGAAPRADRRARVVIVGGGFGGLTAARGLRNAPVHVTVIDRHNYHLFQPLLYQVATAGLSPADIASPIRAILRDQANATVLLGEVDGIDVAGRAVRAGARRIPYDQLVVATGARHAYFGHDEWERFAPGLKKIDDATDIRRRILLAFERAESSADAAARQALLTFVVVGAGATGVELAGAIAELARKALRRDFRHIDPSQARIILVEGLDRVLASFPPSLSAAAQRALARLGVELRLGAMVSQCDAEGVIAGGARIPARTVVWAAGVRASPAAEWLAAEHDRAGRVVVGPDLTLPGHPEIFVIGDAALAKDGNGKPLPGMAQTAEQEGRYVARVIASRARGRPAPPPFRFRNRGSLATIGRSAAVADFGWLRLRGRLAWLLWGVVHIYFLIGFRNRMVVMLEWIWAYLTFQRGARLITGLEEERPAPPAAPSPGAQGMPTSPPGVAP
ncbi:MAG TPA: NAD(P)/FAD-dependent oxidoreductase [Alphaproteobacteria bacterium]|nr:NAD(P)/FAD-dependent oxidoreductase [Alphaproteobacteria bacterium]